MSSTARLCTTLICSVILFLCQSKAIAFPTQGEIQPNDQNGSIYGYARKKEKSELQYTEVFHDDPLSNTLRVSYWSPERKAIAYKQLVFGSNPQIPDLFEFIDYRRARGFRITVNGNIANVKNIKVAANGTETLKSEKTVEIDSNTVIDASFHRFILADWDQLMTGKSAKVKFMRIDKATLIPLQIKRSNCENEDNICFKVSIDNMVLQAMLPSFYMNYDKNKRLIRYSGIGPITKLNNKPQSVNITYDYVQGN